MIAWSGAASANDPIAGIWIDHSGKGAIEIAPCPNAPARLCGHVVWMRTPNGRDGRPLLDTLNPDAAQRGKPMCGAQIIGDLAKASGGAWGSGWIYNPEDGGRFDLEVRPRGVDRLTVLGYAGLKFLGETYVWTRAPADLVRCARS